MAAGAVSEEDYLRLLWRRVARETELARPSMGALADRHWPAAEMTTVSELFGVDLDRRRAERTYRTFGPADDDFHDEEMTDRWWETETQLVLLERPRAQSRRLDVLPGPTQRRLCNGGAWVWDDRAAYPWELAYRAEYSGLQLPPRAERDMRDFEWPNGVHVRVLEPLTTLRRLVLATRAGSRWTSTSRRSWRPIRTRRASSLS